MKYFRTKSRNCKRLFDCNKAKPVPLDAAVEDWLTQPRNSTPLPTELKDPSGNIVSSFFVDIGWLFCYGITETCLLVWNICEWWPPPWTVWIESKSCDLNETKRNERWPRTSVVELQDDLFNRLNWNRDSSQNITIWRINIHYFSDCTYASMHNPTIKSYQL